ncbi:MAG: hypothetical protein ACRDHP_15240, partial [Ktedonobacterales bacterium]
MEKNGIKGGQGEVCRRELPIRRSQGRAQREPTFDQPRATLILPATGADSAKAGAVRGSAQGMRTLPPASATHPHLTAPTWRVPAQAEQSTRHDGKRDALPGETLVLPATRVARRATTARPIRARDTALVE